jgi:hypothetical protein
MLIFILIIAGCFVIGYLSRGTLGILALLLSFLSFVLGIAIYADLASEKALNGELLEVKKKYYELKYIKDKVE